MLAEFIISVLAGVLIGTITGLSPGIHINLVAGLTLANLGLLSGISPLTVSIFIAALSISHTFIDFIPSIFLGAPEEDTILSVLPGHKMLSAGKGYEAVMLALQGSAAALAIGLICTPIYLLALGKIQEVMQSVIPYVLLWVSIYIVLREKRPLSALTVFAFAGILGFFAFNLPIKEPLMPLLTGMFGLSGIITSIAGKKSVPEQKPVNRILLLNKSSYLKSAGISSVIGPLCSFLPGIGSSHISLISAEIVPHNSRQFLFLNGISNTLAMMLSFVAAYVIGKTRTGSAAAIKELLSVISSSSLVSILLACIVSGTLAYFIGKIIAGRASILLSKVNYTKLSFCVLIILVAVNGFMTNPTGLLLLVTSASLGIWAIKRGVRRINLMGSLLVPTILYYLVG